MTTQINSNDDSLLATTTASETVAPVKEPESLQTTLMGIMPMVLIFLVFYFLLIRPQEKRRREQQALNNDVKKGEEVVTSSGIFGIVSKVNDKDEVIEIEISKDVHIKILRNSIADIVSRKKEVKTIPAKGK